MTATNITPTTPFTLLADLVERATRLNLAHARDEDLTAHIRELRALADQARAVVNSPLCAAAFNATAPLVPLQIASPEALAAPKRETSPPAPGTGFYPPHTTPAPVASSSDPEPPRQYWVMDENYPTEMSLDTDFGRLDSLRASPEDDLSDEGFSVSVADYGTDKAVEVQADMWFHSRGFFKLSTSDALPADVMARALAAAYLVVRDAAYERFDNLDKHPADR